MTYTLIENSAYILRDFDGAHIPPDPNNRDWQDYQSWLAAGNVPAPPLIIVETLVQRASDIASIATWKIKVMLSEQASAVNVGKTLLDDANAAIATQSQSVQIAWNNAAEVSYSSKALAGMCAAIGVNQTQFDNMWIAAAAVEL
jgi:hypothetical protein